jgi:hypothetical protein
MSFIQLGRVRIAARRQSGDVSFFEDGPPPPVLPALTAHEEAESLAMWRRARKRRAKEAETSRGLTSMALYAMALVALSHMDRAIESWATPQADGDGGAPPDRPGEVAAADGVPTPLPLSVGLAWSVLPDGMTEAPAGTGASIIWPVRAAPGSSTIFTETMVRLETAATPAAASADGARVEIFASAPGADAMRLPTPMTSFEAAIVLPAEARLPAAARGEQSAEVRSTPREAATASQPTQAETQLPPTAAPVVETVVASLSAPAMQVSPADSIGTVEVKQVWTPPAATVEVTPVSALHEPILLPTEPSLVIEVAQPIQPVDAPRAVETQADKAAIKAEGPVAKGETPAVADAAGQPVRDLPKENGANDNLPAVEVAAPSPAQGRPAEVEVTPPAASNGRPVEVGATSPSAPNGRPAEVEVASPAPATGQPATVDVSAGMGLPKLGEILSGILNPGHAGAGGPKAAEAVTGPTAEAGPPAAGPGAAGGRAEEARAEVGVTVPPGQAGDGPGRSGSAPGRQEAANPPAAAAEESAPSTPAPVAVADAAPPAATPAAASPGGAAEPPPPAANAPSPAVGSSAEAQPAAPGGTPASPAAPAVAAEAASPGTPPGQAAKAEAASPAGNGPPAAVAEAGPPTTPPGQAAGDPPATKVESTSPAGNGSPAVAAEAGPPATPPGQAAGDPPVTKAEAAPPATAPGQAAGDPPVTKAEAALPATPPGQPGSDAPAAPTAEATPPGPPAPQAADPGAGPKPAQVAEAPPAAASQPAADTAEAGGNGPKATPASNRPAEAGTKPAEAQSAVAKGAVNGKDAAEEPEDVQAALNVVLAGDKGMGQGSGPKGPANDPGPAPEAVTVTEVDQGIPPITSDLIF